MDLAPKRHYRRVDQAKMERKSRMWGMKQMANWRGDGTGDGQDVTGQPLSCGYPGMQCRLGLLVAVTVAVVLVLSAKCSFANASSSDARQHGGLLFETSGCQQCHSIFGIGGHRAPGLGSVGLSKDSRQIRQQIVNGGGGMPPFGHVLTKPEVDDLVDFLSSCKSKAAPGCRKWMPQLSQQRSEDDSDDQ